MKLAADLKGSTVVEYALITLVAVSILAGITQLVGSDIFGIYLERVIRSFLVKVDGMGDMISAAKILTRY